MKISTHSNGKKAERFLVTVEMDVSEIKDHLGENQLNRLAFNFLLENGFVLVDSNGEADINLCSLVLRRSSKKAFGFESKFVSSDDSYQTAMQDITDDPAFKIRQLYPECIESQMDDDSTREAQESLQRERDYEFSLIPD